MTKRLRRGAAFSLVEVTLALGVMAFCLVAVFGLLPVGFNSNQVATEQTAAAGIAAALAADLRQTPAATALVSAPPSPRFLISVPSKSSDILTHTLFLNEDGAVADAAASDSPPTSAQDKSADLTKNPRYRAAIVFRLPTNPGTDRTATSVRILITWPALSSSTGGALPTQYSGAFETIIALDRN